YQSAAHLADDLARFREGRPILARPVGLLERGGRWCRRNPWPALLLAGIVLSLLSGAGASLGFGLQAVEAARREKVLAQTARENEQRAKDQEVQTRQEINKLFVARGVELADRGDLYGALAWFARPLDAHSEAALDEDLHLQRLSNYWRHTP